MQHYWQTVIGRQFAAAIQMLRSAIEACPEDLWDDRSSGTPFWHLAYHALFYADFYFSDDPESFEARDYHVAKAETLPGDYGERFGVVSTPVEALTKTQLLGKSGQIGANRGRSPNTEDGAGGAQDRLTTPTVTVCAALRRSHLPGAESNVRFRTVGVDAQPAQFQQDRRLSSIRPLEPLVSSGRESPHPLPARLVRGRAA